MKLRRRDEEQTVYFDVEGDEVERDVVLQAVRGRPLGESKEVLADYQKTTVREWTDREGNVVAKSYGNVLIAMEMKPADADRRRADLLQRLREAQAKLASPDVTQQDMADAMALQIEYLELMDQMSD